MRSCDPEFCGSLRNLTTAAKIYAPGFDGGPKTPIPHPKLSNLSTLRLTSVTADFIASVDLSPAMQTLSRLTLHLTGSRFGFGSDSALMVLLEVIPPQMAGLVIVSKVAVIPPGTDPRVVNLENRDEMVMKCMGDEELWNAAMEKKRIRDQQVVQEI